MPSGGSDISADLNQDALIDVCLSECIDAAHPGYDFLSENGDFSRAEQQNGLLRVGPSPAVIDNVGEKSTAQRIATEAGPPTVLGADQPVNSVAEAKLFTLRYGLPVIAKEAFGGGGGQRLRFMRLRDDLPPFFESAQREAELPFGRGDPFAVNFRNTCSAWWSRFSATVRAIERFCSTRTTASSNDLRKRWRWLQH